MSALGDLTPEQWRRRYNLLAQRRLVTSWRACYWRWPDRWQNVRKGHPSVVGSRLAEIDRELREVGGLPRWTKRP